ncbi:MAG: hypothetical protein K6G54_03185, partial [Oscillospiraceae bacterium]|nr:hypothetical protein [Oscillospiraceae bacterium]
EGEMTMKRVARSIASSQEQATRAVAPLADAGYVERRTDPSNRTRVYVRLSESGRQLLEEKRAMLTEGLSARLNAALSEEEKTAMYEASSCIIQLTEKIVSAT